MELSKQVFGQILGVPIMESLLLPDSCRKHGYPLQFTSDAGTMSSPSPNTVVIITMATTSTKTTSLPRLCF